MNQNISRLPISKTHLVWLELSAMTAITETAKSRRIFNSSLSRQQEIIIKELPSVSALLQQPSPSIQLSPLSPLQQPPTCLVKTVPELGRMAAFDCEWHRDDLKENLAKGIAGDIYAFCLVDSQGKEVKLHANNYPDRRFVCKL